jgi:FKBP-type peptidyl-prolyl cis-trans isomerase SlyD
MQRILYILAVISLLFIACKNGSEEINLSSETRVSAFTFYADTANPGLTEAVYRIEHKELPDTGRIYCVDSLRYGTCLDSVVPQVSYKITPSSAIFFTPDTTIVSTGVDTLNFSQGPIYLFVQAADTVTKRWYRIDVHVHTKDPNLYIWQQMTNQIFASQHCETKAFYNNGILTLYVNNGFSTTIYQSANGMYWQKAEAPTGLPTPCQVRDIMQYGDTLYYVTSDKLYTSTDYFQWTETDFSNREFSLVNMLVVFDNKAWCILQDRATEALLLGTVANNDIQPLDYIHGTGSLLPKLEAHIEGMEPGDKFDVTLAPADGYGEVDPNRIIDLPKAAFEVNGEIREDLLVPGNTIPMMNSMGGVIPGVVIEVSEDSVKMDLNHQMAGKTLHFTGEVLSVREATEKELTEGLHGEFVHTCGCGGCHGGDCGGGCEGGHCGEGHDGDCGCGCH